MIEFFKKIPERTFILIMLATAITALWFNQIATQQECKKCPDQFTEYLKTSNVMMIQALDRNSEALEKQTQAIEYIKK